MRLSKPWLRTLSALFVNIAAAWFAVALISSVFFSLSIWSYILMTDILNGMFYLYLAVRLDEMTL